VEPATMSTDKNHYAEITPASVTYQVFLNDKLLLESDQALELHEHHAGKDYPVVVYFPSLSGLAITKTAQSSYCPIKGDASYWDYGDVENAIWCYEKPLQQVAEIEGHFGFNQSRGFRITKVHD
jgi:uncharacterized protein (DUF427 family)